MKMYGMYGMVWYGRDNHLLSNVYSDFWSNCYLVVRGEYDPIIKL